MSKVNLNNMSVCKRQFEGFRFKIYLNNKTNSKKKAKSYLEKKLLTCLFLKISEAI